MIIQTANMGNTAIAIADKDDVRETSTDQKHSYKSIPILKIINTQGEIRCREEIIKGSLTI